MTSRNRTTRLCLFGAAVALVAGGCGNDKEPKRESAANATLGEAAQKTMDQGSARQKLDFHTEPGGVLAFTIDGVVDLRADNSRGRISYRAFPGVPSGTRVDQIQFDQVDYFRPAGEANWIRTKTTPEDELNNATDVPSSLRHLGGVVEDVRAEGTETLGGERTTRYRGIVDARRVAEATAGEHREESVKRLARFNDTRLPVEVWIGDRGFVRRVRYDIPFAHLKVPSQGEKTMVIDISLSDFGVRAPIRPPPPAQTQAE